MKDKKPMVLLGISFGPRKKHEMDDETEMEGSEEYSQGGSLKMVDKGGEKVPFFAADGKGKMMGGGMTYAKGGMTKGGRDGCAIKGKTKGRMV